MRAARLSETDSAPHRSEPPRGGANLCLTPTLPAKEAAPRTMGATNDWEWDWMVRIGIIGTGWGANVQAPAFRCVAGAELVAVTSGRRERAEVVAQEFGIDHAYDDYREMLG